MKILSLLSVGLLLLVAACDSSNPGKEEAAVETKTVRWKHTPKSAIGIPKGLIIQTRGTEVVGATFVDLKEGPGFETAEQLSQGVFVANQKAILFPMGRPPIISVEDWIGQGGPCLEVKYPPTGKVLVGNFVKMPAGLPPLEFELVAE